jgi:hypothetical protein
VYAEARGNIKSLLRNTLAKLIVFKSDPDATSTHLDNSFVKLSLFLYWYSIETVNCSYEKNSLA